MATCKTTAFICKLCYQPFESDMKLREESHWNA